MRLLLDTNIFVYMVNEPDRLTDDVRALLEDPEYMKYLSTESIRELIVAYRSKGLLSDVWHSEREMVDDIYNSWMWTVDAVDHGVLRRAGVHVEAVEGELRPGGVEVFVFDLAQAAAV